MWREFYHHRSVQPTKFLDVGGVTALLLLAFCRVGFGTLDLGPPHYVACGPVTINGFVATDPPAQSLTWDWGDGATSQSWFPATHHYVSSGTYTVAVTASPTGETNHVTVTTTDADDPTCSYRINVTPTWVLLRDGQTAQPLHVEIRDAEGNVLPNSSFALHFGSDNPGVVSASPGGVVSCTGIGHAWITVSADGITQQGRVRVAAGRFWIEPAVLYLSVAGDGSTAVVRAFAENADGSSLSGSVAFDGGNSVASVNPTSGVVTALSPPLLFGDSPYLGAVLNRGTSNEQRSGDNATFVRVTADDLGLTPLCYAGEHVELWTPTVVCTWPLAELVADLQAVEVLDGVYAVEQWLTDVTPFDGEPQRLVLDPGTDADGTVPCGLGGNPIRLGTGLDNCRSCFGGGDSLQWGVMAHEMGHSFMVQQAFRQFCGLLRDRGGTYSEGMATILGIYAIDEIVRDAGTYGLSSATVENLSRQEVFLGPAFARTTFYAALEAYESSPDYDEFTADHLDAILTQLHDEFGGGFLYRLLSAFFSPHSDLAIPMRTEAEALSFWVAVCSAAAGTDLLDRFVVRWSFPLDMAFYQQILPSVRALVGQREDSAPGPGASREHALGVPGWHMVSLPGTLCVPCRWMSGECGDLVCALDDDLDPFIAYRYDANSATYAQVPPADGICYLAGMSVWVYTYEADTEIGAEVTMPTGNVELALQDGWNQVGNPYAFSIGSGSILVQCGAEELPLTDAQA